MLGRPFLKIFFRYLFLRLFVPFAVGLAACTLIWVMVDLYGNIDDFLEHKINVFLILRFYALQIPSMLVQVLPAALLFSTLWTLLALNRRSELVAFQSGGMAPIWLYSPFFVFALIWVIILAVDMNWPAARAEVTRERLLAQVKGQSAKNNVFVNLPYVDNVNGRVWFFQSLDINQNKGKDVEILQRDSSGRDMVKYFATDAEYTSGGFWRLSGVKQIDFSVTGGLRDQKVFETLDLTDVTTTPKQLSLIVSQPDQLTVSQLSQYISTSTSTPENLAKYRTEWWYRLLYPLTLIVLMFFALLQGARTDRRSALGGIMLAIVVLICFLAINQIFLAAGRFNRLPPFIAAISTEVIFGGIGLYLLAMKNGWGSQILEHGRRWKAQWEAMGRDDAE
jgi:lipopolysaccharide export system permease protein